MALALTLPLLSGPENPAPGLLAEVLFDTLNSIVDGSHEVSVGVGGDCVGREGGLALCDCVGECGV
jgi:hypothetical protein